MQPRLHGPDRPVNDLRDLIVALAPFVEQDEDLAVIAAEGIYRGADLGPQFNRIIGRALIRGLVQVVRELRPLCTSNRSRFGSDSPQSQVSMGEEGVRSPNDVDFGKRAEKPPGSRPLHRDSGREVAGRP